MVLYITVTSAVAPFCSIAASHLLLAASLLGLVLVGGPLRLPPVKLPLVLFLAGTLAALLVSGHIREGWPQVRKFYVFGLVLVCLPSALSHVRSWLALFHCWVAAAVCSALWGVAQFSQTLIAAGRAGDSMYHALVGHRVTGFMSLWTTFAGQMMIVLLIVLALVLFSRQGRRNWRYLAPSGVAIFGGLVIALTRGPWIGACAGVVYLLWQWNRKTVLVLPLLMAVGFLAAPTTIRERVGSIARPTSELDSNSHRLVLWRAGVEMVKAHPWFGVGPEQVGKQFASYLPAGAQQPLPFGWYGHLHNIYLQYAAERGLPVLAMFFWFVIRVLKDFQRALRRCPAGLDTSRALIHGCVAGILACLVAGLFEHNLGDSEMLQLFLTLVAAGYAVAPWGNSADQPADCRQRG